MLSRLSIASLVIGLVPGIYTIITCVSLFVLYISNTFGIYPFGSFNIRIVDYLIGFSVMWVYLTVWILIIFVAIPSVISIVYGSIDLVKNKPGPPNKKRRKFDIAGLILSLSPVIVIGIFFIPSVSSLISKIPG